MRPNWSRPCSPTASRRSPTDRWGIIGAEASRAGYPSDYAGGMTELFFTSLLALVTVLITWFAIYVVYRLFKTE